MIALLKIRLLQVLACLRSQAVPEMILNWLCRPACYASTLTVKQEPKQTTGTDEHRSNL